MLRITPPKLRSEIFRQNSPHPIAHNQPLQKVMNYDFFCDATIGAPQLCDARDANVKLL